jgi:hypothetical protein
LVGILISRERLQPSPSACVRPDRKGLTMKKFAFVALASLAVSAAPAAAADLVTKARTIAPPPPPAWDIAFGAAVMSDYNFRGISQSNRRPSVTAYFEPRYNINPNLQVYAGVGGYSISFPNNAAAEIDFYGGIRPTFGKLALDVGVWYYYYPGGRTFNGLAGPETCTNLFFAPAPGAGCNIIKSNLSFVEVFGKATYTFNDNWAIGASAYYAPDWLNSGADGLFATGSAKYTATAFPSGLGWYVSAEVGHYWLGTTDAFYGTFDLPDYTAWHIGIGFTYKVFTLDFRYYDTDLSKGECNALTGDHTATFSPANIIPVVNPSGLGSKWCGAAFVAALKADLTLNTNIK